MTAKEIYLVMIIILCLLVVLCSKVWSVLETDWKECAQEVGDKGSSRYKRRKKCGRKDKKHIPASSVDLETMDIPRVSFS